MRRASLIIGFVVLALQWLGPLPELAEHAFWAHMTMHMGVVAVVAACLAFGVAGTRMDPAPRRPAVFSPITASIAELVVVWGWHAPGLHAFARGSLSGLVLEQGSFLLVGVWLWLAAFGGGSAALSRADDSVRSRRGAGVAGLLFTSMHMTLLGALLALTPRVLYGHMGGTAALTALQDQHLGGAIMLLVGGAAYLAGGLYLTATLVRGEAPSARGAAGAEAKDAAAGAARGAADDAPTGAAQPAAVEAVPAPEGTA